MHKTPPDIFADIQEPVTFSPVYGDDIPDVAEHTDPFYLVAMHEEDIIEHFDVNLVGHPVEASK